MIISQIKITQVIFDLRLIANVRINENGNRIEMTRNGLKNIDERRKNVEVKGG